MAVVGKIACTLLVFSISIGLIMLGLFSIRQGSLLLSVVGCVAIIMSAQWVPIAHWIWRQER